MMTNAKPSSSKAVFRQRCQYALLHPVTLGALGILLLNDLVLKGLWPNPWTTGKLSDLAWVVFASPLLAYLLSLATPGGRRTQRAIWIAAYIGLPLLYAAFNTFAPLHDAILWGLSLVSGGVGGSPLDATDSLVIPLGLAIALWVWQRGQATLPISRQHIAMGAAGLAVFASVATSYPAPNYGVVGFATTGAGGFATYCDGYYETTNGGFTWGPSSYHNEKLDYPLQGDELKSVVTPRGAYSINEYGVMHSLNNSEPAYSTEYLRSESARWLQEHDTSHLSVRESVTDSAHGITYDAQSDNVIVAMGLQGIIIGTPGGEWTRVAVGPCRPTDFSFSGRVATLLSTADFRILVVFIPIVAITLTVSIAAIRVGMPAGTLLHLVSFVVAIALVILIISLGAVFLLWPDEIFFIISLSLAIMAIAFAVLAVAAWRVRMPHGSLIRTLAFIAAAVLAVMSAFCAVWLIWPDVITNIIVIISIISIWPIPMIATLMIIVLVAAKLGNMPRGSLLRSAALIAATVLAVIASLCAVLVLWEFDHNAIFAFDYSFFLTGLFIAIGLGTALTSFAVCIGSFANKRFLFGASAVAALALSAQVLLAFLVWVNSDFSPLFVKISVIIMAVLTGCALQHYLTRKEWAE